VTTIHLLGSEGFIGRAIQRSANKHTLYCWSHQHSDPDHYFDLLDSSSWHSLLNQQPKHVIFLAWPGLPNYQETFHITRNLPASVELIEKLAERGLQRILVAGTCYEYGLQNGPLNEEIATKPINCYGIAKDSLRRVLQNHFKQSLFQWCWLRIFYPYGEGQSPRSLFPSLIQAIRAGEISFPIGSGKQIRDFIQVEEVAKQMLVLLQSESAYGIYNCGSGIPCSVYHFVQKVAATYGSSINILRGVYPGRPDEPSMFWADMNKYKALLTKKHHFN